MDTEAIALIANKAFQVIQMIWALFQLGVKNYPDLLAKAQRSWDWLFGGEEKRTPELTAMIESDFKEIKERRDKAFAERKQEAIELGLIPAE